MFLSQYIAPKKRHTLAYGLITIGLAFISKPSHALDLQCNHTNSSNFIQRKVCQNDVQEMRQQLLDKLSTAYLISDAPQRLLTTTQQLWLKRLTQCKTSQCVEQQMDYRLTELNLYITLNQSLTQHYLKTSQGEPSKQLVYLQLHQLNKDRIKIEGIAYRNPNNSLQHQKILFNAYTPVEKKESIQNIEDDCRYEFKYYKAFLTIHSDQKKCERFNGLYRLYD